VVWAVAGLGVGVFVVVHAEFAGGDLAQGVAWLLRKL
jgi:hypothetical protein